MSLVEKLLDRLYERWEKEQIKGYLESIREKHDLSNRQLGISGTLDDLRETFIEAINAQYLGVTELAQLVDRLEENGDQHIFPFNFTQEATDLTLEDALKVFEAALPTPVEEYYSETPPNFLGVRRRGGIVVVKQTHTTSYWKTLATRTEGRHQTIEREMVDRRAVNLLRIDPERNRAEIRLSRLASDDSDRQVAERLNAFLETVRRFVDVRTAFTPLPVWDAYHLVATDRDETLMKWDSPSDGKHSMRFASRLLKLDFWDDIRDSPDYPHSSPVYARDEVRIFWVRGSGPDREPFEVRLSDIKLKPMRFGKVEFFEVLEPDAVTYVLGRVRDFVSRASI